MMKRFSLLSTLLLAGLGSTAKADSNGFYASLLIPSEERYDTFSYSNEDSASSSNDEVVAMPTACSACRATTGFIATAVHFGNMSLEVIEAGAKIACAAQFGQTVVPACDLILNRFNDVIAWIGKGLTPEDICKQLGLCTSENTEFGVVVNDSEDTDTCAFCTQATTVIESAVKQDAEAVGQVRQALELVCDQVSNDSMCKLLLEHYDLVAGWLEKGVAPREICEKIGLCSQVDNSSQISNDVAVPDQCELCQHVTSSMEAALEKDNSSLPIVRKEIEMLCKYLGENTQCTKMLSKFDTIAKWLESGMDAKTVCQKLGFCSEDVVESVTDSDLPCQLCTATSQLIQQVAQVDNSSIPMIQQGLDQLCQYLPGMFKCDHLLEKFDELSQLIQAGTDPAAACAKIGMCSDSDEESSLEIIFDEEEILESPDIPCSLCTATSQAIQIIAQVDNSSIPMLKQSLEQVCEYLPGLAKCDLLLEKFDDLSQMVQAGTDPQEACSKIGMCSAELQNADTKNGVDMVLDVEELLNSEDIPCSLCTATTQAIQIIAQVDNSSIPMLKQSLDQVCEYLPGLAKCDLLLEKFDELSQMVQAGTDPEEACAKIGMCSSGNTEEGNTKNQFMVVDVDELLISADIPCSLCTATTQAIQIIAQVDNSSIPMLKQSLEQVCEYLPGLAKCDTLLEKFDDLSQMVQAGTDPEEACTKIGMCTGDSEVSLPEAEIAVENEEARCEFCQTVSIGILDALDFDESFLPSMKKGLGSLCSEFLHEYECDSVLSKFESLAELLKLGTPPKAACVEVGQCMAVNVATTATDAPRFRGTTTAIQAVA